MIDIAKLESEITGVCIKCKQEKFKLITDFSRKGRDCSVDHKGRRWKSGTCPECINEYKAQWNRDNYKRLLAGERRRHDKKGIHGIPQADVRPNGRDNC